MTLNITVNLNTCDDCRYRGHSGSFTIRGARPICEHGDACKERKPKSVFKGEYPELKSDIYDKDWKYHWFHRTLTENSDEKVKGIPEWCPLKHGAGY